MLYYCRDLCSSFHSSPSPPHPSFPLSAPFTAVSLSEVVKVVESLGKKVGRSQVRQVALTLGFTPSEVTSIEQVVGGGESASMMLLHLLLVWQEQKQAGREEARGKLAAALNEGGMQDAAAKLDQRCECVCVFITCHDDS